MAWIILHTCLRLRSYSKRFRGEVGPSFYPGAKVKSQRCVLATGASRTSHVRKVVRLRCVLCAPDDEPLRCFDRITNRLPDSSKWPHFDPWVTGIWVKIKKIWNHHAWYRLDIHVQSLALDLRFGETIYVGTYIPRKHGVEEFCEHVSDFVTIVSNPTMDYYNGTQWL